MPVAMRYEAAQTLASGPIRAASDLRLFAARPVMPSAYGRFCIVLTGVFQAVNQLPEPGRALVLRDIYLNAGRPASSVTAGSSTSAERDHPQN